MERRTAGGAAQVDRTKSAFSAAQPPKGQAPNLASQALGAALRALPGQWRDRFGYTPLLAESFTDPEAYAGTCYKASDWEAVGYSAGYSRHRADFYLPNDQPKQLWLRPLSAQARQTLRVAQLPEECRAGLSARPSGTLPVNAQQLESLLDVFWKAPDPRMKNAHYPVGSVLTLIARWRFWPGGGRSPRSPVSPPV
ncbi:hypothetical protein [Verrucomicrobium sp. 3C]|uniref:hypothetical protein n=1 Tax=Verrucomicrobium sp. 3C TaxID=1134055 RepID=UPI0031B649F2